jgi:hypothetical protein
MTAPSKPVPQKDAPKDGRTERLAAALRENLKRRKAQARGRAETRTPEEPHDSAGFGADKRNG